MASEHVASNPRLHRFEVPEHARKPYQRRYSDMSRLDKDVTLKSVVEYPAQIEANRPVLAPPNGGQRHSANGRNSLPDLVAEVMRRRSQNAGLPSGNDSADTKGKRHQEMVERFQVRRLASKPSSTNQEAIDLPTGGSAVESVPAQPMTQAQSTTDSFGRLFVPPLQVNPRRSVDYTNSRHFWTSESDPQGPNDSVNRSSRWSLKWRLVAMRRILVRSMRKFFTNVKHPITPTSAFSRFRITVLTLTFAAHVVVFPVTTAFYAETKTDQDLTLDILVELILVADLVLMFNTAYFNKRNTLVTSRPQIARHYIRGWFAFDLISSIPVDLIIVLAHGSSQDHAWIRLSFDVVCRSQRLIHVLRLARSTWTLMMDGSDRSIFAWLLYSRYSHLFRIVWIIGSIVLIAHYLACGWHLLVMPLVPSTRSPLEDYVARLYDVLQLLQGEGIATTTVAQNIFATFALLLGSIALAIVFGNVAILVSNFNANSTNYQRKMESVFAIMSKMQLPGPLRDRIHQYYEHLWREYESLDGEIVAFSKSLSHTLELEVVLFKYMDLILHVPFWRDGSPDFQKQLMLHLQVRVYLPDDFIIRRGEVGDEFFMLNRGVCELVLGPDSIECMTEPLAEKEDSEFSEVERDPDDDELLKHDAFTLPSARSARKEADDAVKPGSPQSVCRGRRDSRGNVYALGESASGHPSTPSSKFKHRLRRGQSFGEMALLMNYERTANVRALTYVEMCVLGRAEFQAILVKHPKDSKKVITSILTKTTENNEATKVWCPLKAAVAEVFGEGDPKKAENISAKHAALLISSAITVPMDDESLKFGVGVRLHEQLIVLRDQEHHGRQSSRRFSRKVIPRPDPDIPVPAQTAVESSSRDMQTLASYVLELQQMQGSMSSTILSLKEEVTTLQHSNQQLQKLLALYETRLTELTRPLPSTAPEQQEENKEQPTTPCTPAPRVLLRRMSRRSSFDRSEHHGPIPEDKPRTQPLPLARSTSVSKIMNTARSTSILSSRKAYASDDSVISQDSARESPTNRRASFTTMRSVAVANLNRQDFMNRSSSSLFAEQLHRAFDSGKRPSFSSRVIAPLKALLTADDEERMSPTKYADQLFNKQGGGASP